MSHDLQIRLSDGDHDAQNEGHAADEEKIAMFEQSRAKQSADFADGTLTANREKPKPKTDEKRGDEKSDKRRCAQIGNDFEEIQNRDRQHDRNHTQIRIQNLMDFMIERTIAEFHCRALKRARCLKNLTITSSFFLSSS